MHTINPFEVIMSRLEQLQTTVNLIWGKSGKSLPSPVHDPDRLIDLTEAATVLRKPVGTVSHYIHHRHLPATKIGKSYLIKFSELLKWVDEFHRPDNSKTNSSSPMLENRKRYGKH